ncbi:glycoside hydrolase family 18 protein [Gymnopilus junonius]|uniref:Glycoside hydrolase family 18 protein n=1 Tax=Gymnopilus junonius TaxID=109634 RepID=A0A9P5NZ73_GYMJU|nr:glycoside hydrolase family 18 protein [Gymnopilus junonius]
MYTKSTFFLLAILCLVAPGFGATINASSHGSRPTVAAAWYAGWHATAGFPLSKVSWSKYTHLTYSFAETTSSVNSLDLSGSDPILLPQFVAEAHKNGVKALVSIGGWTGSRFYSSDVGSVANRTAFVKTVVNFVKKYNLDGLDFDWEYPGSQGIGCNLVNGADAGNFLSFLQELRANPMGAKLTLSAAVSLSPFAGSDGNPLSDVSSFAAVLDWIAIMNYDVWGPWSSAVGPNAPLNDSCAAPENQDGSAVSGVEQWNQVGMPFSQIVLGVAAYGHSFTVPKAGAFVSGSKGILVAYPLFDPSNPPVGDSWDDGAGVDECGNLEGPGATSTSGPYVYNSTSQIMVSFDNAQSFAAKGRFIFNKGLRGFAMWEAGGDFNDILLNSIRVAAWF